MQFSDMTRKPKASLPSLSLSSNHDYISDAHSSRSPYESYHEDDESQQSIGDRHFFVASSSIPSQNSNFQPSNFYVNVAPLPVFHGQPNECPFAHLSRFFKVCRANNAFSTDTMMRIFPVTLENEAALWYDLNIEPYPSLSWDEIKLSFLEAYRRIEIVDQLRSELLMLNQAGEESVRSYFLRMQWILRRWPEHGLSDNMLKGIFIDGLMKDFRDWIIPQKPSSLNEALSLAFSFEQVKSIRGGAKQKVGKCCESRERTSEMYRKRITEKQMMCSSEEGNESDEAEKGIAYEDEDDDNRKEEEEGMFRLKKTENRQCQCSKHKCWKKKLLRNNSEVTRNSST